MRCTLVALLPALLAPALFSQGAAPGDAQTTVIRSNPRLVLVNVVVSDAAGKPVHGLAQRDFTLLEDGKPQTIRAFDEHSAAAPVDAAAAPALNLGPNVHTNWIQVPKNQVTNILLFDMLNMSGQDLVSAKAELLKTVKNLPSGQQFALFVMGNQLHMIQGFTWDREAMSQAAAKLPTAVHAGYSDARTMSSQVGELEESMAFHNGASFRGLVTTLATEQDIKVQSRSIYTSDALYQLARSLIAVPGRKNLIWITSGFPFDASRGDMDRFTRLTSQLAASQIAVYPIDARGVIAGQPDATTRDSELFVASGDKVGPWLATMSEEQRATYESMSDIAAQTGGRAFFNQNTFLPAISRIVESGSNYYVIAYRPNNNHWDGSFRKIQVKTSRRDVKLLYRTGYYAIDDPLQLPRLEDRDRALQIAMQAAAPPSTTLIVKTRVVPPADGSKPVQLDYLVDVSDLTAREEAAEKKKDIDVVFIATATDPAGHVSASHAWSVKQQLNDAELQAMRRRGLQIHEDFPLQSGDYQLRLGVLDRNSGKIGTLDVPVNIAQTATPAK